MAVFAIIGAGPAGLSAAASICRHSQHQVLIFDMGKTNAERNHQVAEDLGIGVGGAGLFSDGKFSFYPSGTKVYDLPDKEILKDSYEWIIAELAKVGIASVKYPQFEKNIHQETFLLKKYPSTYGALSQRHALISNLSSLNNCYFFTETRVTEILKKNSDDYSLHYVSLFDGQKHVVSVDNIIIATGRLGNSTLSRLLPNMNVNFNDLRYEFGLRIEAPANIGFLSCLSNPDVKAIWQTSFGEVRTFCTCRHGEIWNIPYPELSALSGRADGIETAYSNFSLLTRFKGNAFATGEMLYNNVLKSSLFSERAAIWQTLDSFLYPAQTKSICGKINQANRPWFPNQQFYNGIVASVIGEDLYQIFCQALQSLLGWSSDLLHPETTVMFPVIEGTGSYPRVDEHLQLPTEKIWFAGDIVGKFRGLIPAFLSGYYAGLKALQFLKNKPQNNPTAYGVGVIIAQGDNVLLGKRLSSLGKGEWGFPGGKVNPGETLVQCAIRETAEETGMEIEQVVMGPTVRDFFLEHNKEYLTTFMIASYLGKYPQVKEKEKCEEWRWFKWNALPAPLFKPIQTLLDTGFKLDVSVQKSLAVNSYKMISLDLDGTLVKGVSCALHFAKLLGVESAVSHLENLFHAQKIDATTFMNHLSKIMGSLSQEYIDKYFDTLPFISGIENFMSRLKQEKIITLIVTSANQWFAEAMQRRYGFDHVYGTKFEKKIDGTLGPGIVACSSLCKVRYVQEMCQKYNITMQQVIAVGDSLSDLPLFTQVGKSIAINYDEHLHGKAHFYIKTDDISELLPHLLNINETVI